jgi:hypothetical protein
MDMITTLSAYKEMLLAPSGRKAQPQSGGDQAVTDGSAGAAAEQPGRVQENSDAVSVELSASHDVFTAVDNFFNLGRTGRFDAFHALSPDDKEQFVKIVAELAKSGYMGYEELVVDKKVERHEVLSQIGDRRLDNARVYDRNKFPRR